MSRYRAAAIPFAEILNASSSGANTYRQIAVALDVPVEDPDLAAAMNSMRHQQIIDFTGGCCTDSMEHSYDCIVAVAS